MEDVAMRIMDMDFTPLSRSTIGFGPAWKLKNQADRKSAGMESGIS
jgi:hypothetical protein